jgi:hypothetical protein
VALTVSRPIQIFALVALLVVVAGAGTLMLHRSPTAAAPPVVAAPAKPAVTVKPAHVAKPAAKAPAAQPVQPAKTPPKLVAANGLPMPLAKALHKHRIVVVSLFDPQAQTDALSFAEARAGAAAAHVGFLGVSVLDDSVAGPLTTVLTGGGLLPDPGVLVYRRPGTLVLRIDGFSDRDAVAQAATAAFTSPALSAATP